MQIENWSTRHPTAKVRPIVEFVDKRVPGHRSTVLLLMDHHDPRRTTTGESWRGLSAPMVHLALGAGVRYPRSTCHVPEVGAVRLRSWHEEVAFVLAHELRHVEQFLRGTFEEDEHGAEVDAEQFAVHVLNQYRRS